MNTLLTGAAYMGSGAARRSSFGLDEVVTASRAIRDEEAATRATGAGGDAAEAVVTVGVTAATANGAGGGAASATMLGGGGVPKGWSDSCIFVRSAPMGQHMAQPPAVHPSVRSIDS